MLLIVWLVFLVQANGPSGLRVPKHVMKEDRWETGHVNRATPPYRHRAVTIYLAKVRSKTWVRLFVCSFVYCFLRSFVRSFVRRKLWGWVVRSRVCWSTCSHVSVRSFERVCLSLSVMWIKLWVAHSAVCRLNLSLQHSKAAADCSWCYSVTPALESRILLPNQVVGFLSVFLSTDMPTQIGVVVVVSIAVMSILTVVLVIIFFVKGTNSRKPRARLVKIDLLRH